MGVVAATAPTHGATATGGSKLNITGGAAKPPVNGKKGLNSTATGATAALVSHDQQELLSEKDILHTPFHTKELTWNRSQYL